MFGDMLVSNGRLVSVAEPSSDKSSDNQVSSTATASNYTQCGDADAEKSKGTAREQPEGNTSRLV
jgi:hypothetical protein